MLYLFNLVKADDTSVVTILRDAVSEYPEERVCSTSCCVQIIFSTTLSYPTKNPCLYHKAGIF